MGLAQHFNLLGTTVDVTLAGEGWGMEWEGLWGWGGGGDSKESLITSACRMEWEEPLSMHSW